MNSASLCSRAGRYVNPIPIRFLAPIDCLKIRAQGTGRLFPLYWTAGGGGEGALPLKEMEGGEGGKEGEEGKGGRRNGRYMDMGEKIYQGKGLSEIISQVFIVWLRVCVSADEDGRVFV
jgi:hypothetical protein